MARFIFLFIWLTTSLTHAETIYKVVDEHGRVTFTQTRPESNTAGVVKMLEANPGTAHTVVVRKEGDLEYCGDIALPSKYDKFRGRFDEKNFFPHVISKQKLWERKKAKIQKDWEARRARHTQKNKYYLNQPTPSRIKKYNIEYLQYKETQITKIKNLDCAINWAQEKHSSIAAYKKHIVSEISRLTLHEEKLLLRLDNACGSKPQKDSLKISSEININSWNSCSNQIRVDLHKIRADINTLNKKIRGVEIN